MKNTILAQFTTECPWRDTLYWYDTVDSTNARAKVLAKEGAPHGTVLIAGSQTGGRGRLGRSFSSPDGMGVYLSVILRPNCKPEKVMHLTCAAGVAACRAVEQVSGIRPGIKWINDLVCRKKKLGGILSELGFDPVTGNVAYAIVGIGINCLQKTEDFPEELQPVATSLRELTDTCCSPARLAAALVEALYAMDNALFSKKQQLMDDYRHRCITLGQEIKVLQSENIRYGTAEDIDADGGLIVRFNDGTVQTVDSGEVSIRGMYGYV